MANASFLSGQKLAAPTVGPARSGRASSLVVQARGVAQAFKRQNQPTWLLDSPKREWEIGGRFWLPLGSFDPPAYLDGTLPGDRGYDPFRLAALWGSAPDDPLAQQSRLAWLLEGELYNGRVAMLAVVGVLGQELLGKGKWWEAVNTSRWGGPTYVVGIVLFHFVFAFLEKTRIESFEDTGEAGHLGFAPFDPLNQVSDYNRQAEIRNCRTAMLANLGFWVQAWVTGKTPLENARDHYSNPFGANVFTYGDKGNIVAGFWFVFTLVMYLTEFQRTRRNRSGGGVGGSIGRTLKL